MLTVLFFTVWIGGTLAAGYAGYAYARRETADVGMRWMLAFITGAATWFSVILVFLGCFAR